MRNRCENDADLLEVQESGVGPERHRRPPQGSISTALAWSLRTPWSWRPGTGQTGRWRRRFAGFPRAGVLGIDHVTAACGHGEASAGPARCPPGPGEVGPRPTSGERASSHSADGLSRGDVHLGRSGALCSSRRSAVRPPGSWSAAPRASPGERTSDQLRCLVRLTPLDSVKLSCYAATSGAGTCQACPHQPHEVGRSVPEGVGRSSDLAARGVIGWSRRGGRYGGCASSASFALGNRTSLRRASAGWPPIWVSPTPT